MGIYVSDGILLGIVVNPKRIMKSSKTFLDHNESFDVIAGVKQHKPSYSIEEAIIHLNNFIKLNNEDAISISRENNPYEKLSNYYFGIFWEWSNRRSLNLDNKMKLLYMKIPNSEKVMKESKNSILGQRVFEIANKIIEKLKPEEIQLYEVRFFE